MSKIFCVVVDSEDDQEVITGKLNNLILSNTDYDKINIEYICEAKTSQVHNITVFDQE